MLSALILPVIHAISGNVIDKVADLFGQYMRKEITKEQLQAKLAEALIGSIRDIEVSHSETLAKTYDSFMKALEKSLLMRVVWATVALSQLLVLLWHQVGIPALVYYAGTKYPSSGSTVEWAYALLGACIGLGPLVLRTGPGQFNIEKYKSLIKRG